MKAMTKTAPESSKIIVKLSISSHFLQIIRLLAKNQDVSEGTVITRGVALYAKAIAEARKGNVLSFVTLGEDNTLKIVELVDCSKLI